MAMGGQSRHSSQMTFTEKKQLCIFRESEFAGWKYSPSHITCCIWRVQFANSLIERRKTVLHMHEWLRQLCCELCVDRAHRLKQGLCKKTASHLFWSLPRAKGSYYPVPSLGTNWWMWYCVCSIFTSPCWVVILHWMVLHLLYKVCL